jgi:hypothetical protein
MILFDKRMMFEFLPNPIAYHASRWKLLRVREVE